MIVFNDAAMARRIASASGTSFNPPRDQCIARVEHGELFGGTLFTGYTGAGGSINVHIAGFRGDWISRELLAVTFDYIFNQLAVNKLIGQVPSYNKAAYDLDLKFGYTHEATIKDVFPEGDLFVMTMYKADCKWLRLKPRYHRRGGG